MSNETREAKDMQIRVFSLAMWTAVSAFIIMGVCFFLGVFPSTQPILIGSAMFGIAVLDVFLIRFMVGKMRRDAGL